jgi:hypothetical protein
MLNATMAVKCFLGICVRHACSDHICPAVGGIAVVVLLCMLDAMLLSYSPEEWKKILLKFCPWNYCYIFTLFVLK